MTNTDFDPPKRLIILSHENKTHHRQQLSTASVFLQQIPTNFRLDGEISITTPLSVQEFHRRQTLNSEDRESQPQKLELKSFHDANNKPGVLPHRNIHPNHRYDVRRQAEENHQPRPFDYIIRGTPPTAFQRNQKNSSSFPQIPKHYVGTVNSIQDILRQVHDEGNSYQDSNGMQKIKIAGTYKHRKADDIASMFESAPRKNRAQSADEPVIHSSQPVNTNRVIRDPFYKYKPNSLSDVNLMATNQFRFAPYHILSNKYVPSGSSQIHSMDPSNLYHQIIMANKNRLKYLDDNSKNDKIQSKQKPFTLMLDVYPMPDDEHKSSNVPLPVKYQNNYNPNMMRQRPPGISSINNLQPFVNSAHYPHQLNANRYPSLPHYLNHNYFRKFGTKPSNSGLHTSNDRESSSNNPSQITVHLNLFPKKKERSDNRNADILNKNDPEKDDPHSISVRLQERMAKLGDKVNQTEGLKEPTNSGKVTNKVDADVFQNKTVSNVKPNVIMIDDGPDDVDSSEDIFSREFLQFQSTDSPTELVSESTTFESKSADNNYQNHQLNELNLIPTILPIEPREYNRQPCTDSGPTGPTYE